MSKIERAAGSATDFAEWLRQAQAQMQSDGEAPSAAPEQAPIAPEPALACCCDDDCSDEECGECSCEELCGTIDELEKRVEYLEQAVDDLHQGLVDSAKEHDHDESKRIASDTIIKFMFKQLVHHGMIKGGKISVTIGG